MEDLYTIPPGVDLAHPELRSALATIGIEQRSYIANGDGETVEQARYGEVTELVAA